MLFRLPMVSIGDGGVMNSELRVSPLSVRPRRSGERLALEWPWVWESRRETGEPAGMAGWMDGNESERSDAGVRSSRMAVLLLTVVEPCWDGRLD